MLISAKAGAKVNCICDTCKREFYFIIPLMEFERLEDFKQNAIDTMNAEGWAIMDDRSWICPECVK
jgi:hypothetical protein